jgi:nitrogenase-associated protein
MARIIFYEKPDCAGNAKQRRRLEAAGHELSRRDLLSTPWTAELLLPFLASLPVSLWFNRAAPRVKEGVINPDGLGAEEALALLLAEPLLIRRPLMEREDGARMVGFDVAEVDGFVGLGGPASAGPGSLEGCVKNPDSAGFFIDWAGRARSVDDPGGGYQCEVDAPARYVAVKTKSGTMVHEATFYQSIEAIAKAGIKAELVAGSFPWGEAD